MTGASRVWYDRQILTESLVASVSDAGVECGSFVPPYAVSATPPVEPSVRARTLGSATYWEVVKKIGGVVGHGVSFPETIRMCRTEDGLRRRYALVQRSIVGN